MDDNINLLTMGDSIPLWAAAQALGMPYQQLLNRVHRHKVTAQKIGRHLFLTQGEFLKLESTGYRPRKKRANLSA